MKIYTFLRPADRKLAAKIKAHNEGSAADIFRVCAIQGRKVMPPNDSSGQQEVLYFDASALPPNDSIIIEEGEE